MAGVDVPVVEILADAAPAVVDERKGAMTVEDVLTMSTGLECRDSARYRNQGMYEMLATDDWAAHMLNLSMVEEPGPPFEYCNGATYLLSAIVTEVAGQPAVEFATEALFEPLRITDETWPSSPDVFLAEFQTFGAQIARGSFEFTFEDETAQVELREDKDGLVETSTAVQTR